MNTTPTAEDQLAFLTKIQRLFNESDFSSTYKYALLISLVDLAVEHGKDDGSELELTNTQIAERFIDLYWQQSTPYRAKEHVCGGILLQNNGSQAAIVKAIQEFRNSNNFNSPESARSSPRYKTLITKVTSTVVMQPINHLQNVGGGTLPFLYEQAQGGVILKQKVAYCLRRFQPLIQQLARNRWADFVKRNGKNVPILGEGVDLEEFLFETSRKTLGIVGTKLKKLYGTKCFYCKKNLAQMDVDHFIPHSLYPRDLMHNFVLACPGCNRSKSDTLAAKNHLENWFEISNKNSDAIMEIGEIAGVSASIITSMAIARWGYGAAMQADGLAWVEPRNYEKISREYLQNFELIK